MATTYADGVPEEEANVWAFVDCAHYGISPNRVVQTLNGDRPAPSIEEDGRSRDELRDWMESMPDRINIALAYTIEAQTMYPDDRDIAHLKNLGAELPRESPVHVGAHLITGKKSGVRRSPTYDLIAGVGAKRMLQHMLAHPKDAPLPVRDLGEPKGSRHTLDGRMSRAGVFFDDLELTGFQFGWCANAAKYILGLPRVANPALQTVQDIDEMSALLQVIDEKLRSELG